MIKILIVEDEEKIARFIELELVHEGYKVIKVNNGRDGLEIAEKGEEILEQDNSATVAQTVPTEVKKVVDATSVNDSDDDELPF